MIIGLGSTAASISAGSGPRHGVEAGDAGVPLDDGDVLFDCDLRSYQGAWETERTMRGIASEDGYPDAGPPMAALARRRIRVRR